MRRIRYSVASSLDGYIAGPNGESDWIIMDPDIDFGQLMGRFDTMLIGRHTYESTAGQGSPAMPGIKPFVVSQTLRPEDHPDVSIIGRDLEKEIAALREAPGKDIWLFGGGVLFRSLLAARLVDAVEVAIIPVLLGAGIPLLPSPAGSAKLSLKSTHVYKKTGIVWLEYALE